VVTAIALALGIAAGVDAARLAVLTISVLCGQLSIGLSNDAIDAPRDRSTGRADKPLARPAAPVRLAWIAAFVSAFAALASSAALDWRLALAHAVFLGCGWAYNAALKSTPWSAACFAVGFGVFPSLAPLALAEPRVAPAWEWVAGAALGIAVHFSNVLPDLEDDERTGVRGLPHRLGRQASTFIAFGALAAGAAAALVGSGLENGSVGWATWSVAGGVLALVIVGIVTAVTRPPTRLSFQIVMIGALLLAAGLVIGSG
jgi:4-hydroxybenzoate polyprenyltransferase